MCTHGDKNDGAKTESPAFNHRAEKKTGEFAN